MFEYQRFSILGDGIGIVSHIDGIFRYNTVRIDNGEQLVPMIRHSGAKTLTIRLTWRLEAISEVTAQLAVPNRDVEITLDTVS